MGAQALQLVVSCRRGTEQLLRQPHHAETAGYACLETQSTPLRNQYLVVVVRQIVCGERGAPDIFSKGLMGQSGRLAVLLQKLPRVSVHSLGFTRHVYFVVEEHLERLSHGHEAPHMRAPR